MDESIQREIREIANNDITEISRISQLVNSTHTERASNRRGSCTSSRLSSGSALNAGPSGSESGASSGSSAGCWVSELHRRFPSLQRTIHRSSTPTSSNMTEIVLIPLKALVVHRMSSRSKTLLLWVYSVKKRQQLARRRSVNSWIRTRCLCTPLETVLSLCYNWRVFFIPSFVNCKSTYNAISSLETDLNYCHQEQSNKTRSSHFFLFILIPKIPCLRKLGRGPRNKGVYRYRPRLYRVQVWPNYSCNHVIVFFFLHLLFSRTDHAPLSTLIAPQVGCRHLRCAVNFSSESFYTYYSNSFNSFVF